MNAKAFWIHALSPLHVGTGQGLGFIDLPIMREKTTNWPLVPGSAIKGVIADRFEANDDARKGDPVLRAAFGKAGEDHSNAGALVFTDARLVCLPLRSLYGTFAWVTSPLALTRLKRDLDHTGKIKDLPVPDIPDDKSILLPEMNTSLLTNTDGKVFFEDFDLDAADHTTVKQWGNAIARSVFPADEVWQRQFLKRFAVLTDDSFDFFCEVGTEVDARIRIDDQSKTVAEGALWYEESLPAESILAGIVWCDWVPKNGGVTQEDLLKKFCSEPCVLQIGGKATTGKGRVRCVFEDGGSSHE